MSEWLAFKASGNDLAFRQALTAFKATVPSTLRRWDSEHGYWLFDPRFRDAVKAIESASIGTAVSLEEDDRRSGRVPVNEDEPLDTALIDVLLGGDDAA